MEKVQPPQVKTTVEWMCYNVTSFASFSLLLILLDLDRGGVRCAENTKATDRLVQGLASDSRQGKLGPDQYDINNKTGEPKLPK